MDRFEDSVTLPFTIPGVFQGLASVAGLLHIGEGALRMEFRVTDAIFGLLRSRVRDIELELTDIESVSFRDGWFRKRIVIQTRRLGIISDLPGGEAGVIVLHVQRRHRERIRECVSRISLGISEARLRAIERRTEQDAERLYE